LVLWLLEAAGAEHLKALLGAAWAEHWVERAALLVVVKFLD
jgi:hypothetical protein